MSVFECWRECNGMCSPKIRFKVFCWSSGLSAPWIWFQEKLLQYCLFVYNTHIDFFFLPSTTHLPTG